MNTKAFDAHFIQLNTHCKQALQTLNREVVAVDLFVWVHAEDAPAMEDSGDVPYSYIDRFFSRLFWTTFLQFKPDEFATIKAELLTHGTSELEIGFHIACMMNDPEFVDAVMEHADQLEQSMEAQETDGDCN